jgi:hypothetical protein
MWSRNSAWNCGSGGAGRERLERVPAGGLRCYSTSGFRSTCQAGSSAVRAVGLVITRQWSSLERWQTKRGRPFPVCVQSRAFS